MSLFRRLTGKDSHLNVPGLRNKGAGDKVTYDPILAVTDDGKYQVGGEAGGAVLPPLSQGTFKIGELVYVKWANGQPIGIHKHVWRKGAHVRFPQRQQQLGGVEQIFYNQFDGTGTVWFRNKHQVTPLITNVKELANALTVPGGSVAWGPESIDNHFLLITSVVFKHTAFIFKLNRPPKKYYTKETNVTAELVAVEADILDLDLGTATFTGTSSGSTPIPAHMWAIVGQQPVFGTNGCTTPIHESRYGIAATFDLSTSFSTTWKRITNSIIRPSLGADLSVNFSVVAVPSSNHIVSNSPAPFVVPVFMFNTSIIIDYAFISPPYLFPFENHLAAIKIKNSNKTVIWTSAPHDGVYTSTAEVGAPGFVKLWTGVNFASLDNIPPSNIIAGASFSPQSYRCPPMAEGAITTTLVWDNECVRHCVDHFPGGNTIITGPAEIIPPNASFSVGQVFGGNINPEFPHMISVSTGLWGTTSSGGTLWGPQLSFMPPRDPGILNTVPPFAIGPWVMYYSGVGVSGTRCTFHVSSYNVKNCVVFEAGSTPDTMRIFVIVSRTTSPTSIVGESAFVIDGNGKLITMLGAPWVEESFAYGFSFVNGNKNFILWHKTFRNDNVINFSINLTDLRNNSTIEIIKGSNLPVDAELEIFNTINQFLGEQYIIMHNDLIYSALYKRFYKLDMQAETNKLVHDKSYDKVAELKDLPTSLSPGIEMYPVTLKATHFVGKTK